MAELCREVFGIQDMDWMGKVFKKSSKNTLLEDEDGKPLYSYTKFTIFWLKILMTMRPSTGDDWSTVSTCSL